MTGRWRVKRSGCRPVADEWTGCQRWLQQRDSAIPLSDFKGMEKGALPLRRWSACSDALFCRGGVSYSFCRASLILSWLCHWALALYLAARSAWRRAAADIPLVCLWIVRVGLLLKLLFRELDFTRVAFSSFTVPGL